MEKVLLIEDLDNAENKTLCCTFDEKIEGIDCVTPIHAELCAKSLGDFVQVTGVWKSLSTNWISKLMNYS